MSEVVPSSIKKVGRREFGMSPDGRQMTRSNGGRWTLVDSGPGPEQSSPLLLILVIQRQAEGEPHHWSLVVGKEGESGTVYQVMGDATCMSYKQKSNVDIFHSQSYETSYEMAKLGAGDQAIVEEVATHEPPPQAENQAAVRENCQDWTVRVLTRLQERGVVSSEKLAVAKEERKKQPLQVSSSSRGISPTSRGIMDHNAPPNTRSMNRKAKKGSRGGGWWRCLTCCCQCKSRRRRR